MKVQGLIFEDFNFYQRLTTSPCRSWSSMPPLQKLFADDIKAYATINSIHQAVSFQLLINCIFARCEYWQLIINGSKSQIVHLGKSSPTFCYHLSSTIIPSPPFDSDLGVIINQNLCFHSHISRMIVKARGRCILFLKSFISRDSKLMLKIFTCYVRPILENCSPIWSSTFVFDIDRIERVQRFFTNKIPGCTFLPYFQRLAKLSLHSLRQRRLVTDLSTFFSLISGHTFASLSPHVTFIPPSVTRSHNLQIYVPILNYKHSNKTSCRVSCLPGIT